MVLQFDWDYTPRVGMLTTVITGTTVAGVSMVTVSGDRTQLTLSGVQREVDGATVVCSALGSTERIPSNPATITVQCRYSYAVVKKLSKKSFFLLLFFFSVYYTHAGPSVYSRAEVNFTQYCNSCCVVWSFNTTNNLLWLMRQTLNSCSDELQRCVASPSCS